VRAHLLFTITVRRLFTVSNNGNSGSSVRAHARTSDYDYDYACAHVRTSGHARDRAHG
jgi:hypothetical protein